MAAHTVLLAKHTTLSAATVDTITMTSVDYPYVAVKNRAAGGAGITFRVDGQTPVALADETYLVLAGEELVVPFKGLDTVKLISATADAYSVTGVEG